MFEDIFEDPKSAYNNSDPDKQVIMTPRQLIDLNIGFSKDAYPEEDWDMPILWRYDDLIEMVRETTLGTHNGSDIALPIENANCTACICLDINGKLCKLHREEWNIHNPLNGLPVDKQVKVFQRLLSEDQIDMNDLAVVDIDNNVYKKLTINEVAGKDEFLDKVAIIDEAYKKSLKKVKSLK